jgi:hypothetical protein
MKYLYVLSSSNTDTYYEQFFLSVTSLRIYNPDANIIVLADQKTTGSLTGVRSKYKDITSEIKTIATPKELSLKESSRWIKTSMRQHISGDFLYIDCDTIITGSLIYDFPADVKIGAIPDCHTPFSRHHFHQRFIDENVRLGFTYIKEIDAYYNGGIIFCRDTPESYAFFEKWHALWKESRDKGNSQDMPSFNRANFEMHNIIREIGGEWNCQISNNGLPYLNKAMIIHYFATSLAYLSSPFLLASPAVLDSIKKTGLISDDIYKMLQDPKSSFEPHSNIIADTDVIDVVNSSIFSILKRLSKNHKNLFKAIDTMVYRLASAAKKARTH